MKYDVDFKITLLCRHRIELSDPEDNNSYENVIQSEIDYMNLGAGHFTVRERDNEIIEIIRVGEPEDDEYEIIDRK